jgi:hypothetical protein
MAFERVDSEALNKARERGFIHRVIDNDAHGWYEAVYQIEFGPQISQGFSAAEIKALLEALIRFSGSHLTTLWLSITTDIIHESVIEAIERLEHFEPRLYVSFKGMASHAPAPPLPDRLQAAVEKSAGRGQMWHPVLCAEVDSKPSRTRQ